MGFIVARYCNIIGSPSDDLGALWHALQLIVFEVYNSIHRDTELFYGLEDADKIDRFYKWVSNAVTLGKTFCLKDDGSIPQPGEPDAKDPESVANIKELFRLHLKNALKAVDIAEIMAASTYVFLEEGSVGKDPRECIGKLVREPVPESGKEVASRTDQKQS